MKKTIALLFLGLGLWALPAAAQTPPLKVVASFSLLGDMVREVAGDQVDLAVLVGPEVDAHTYQPTPDDVKKLAAADVIVVNGLKFESWLGKAISASGSKAKLLVASAGVRPRVMEEPAEEHGHHHEAEGHVIVDPHAWQNLRNGQLYAKNIAQGLAAARPDLAPALQANLASYTEKLESLDAELQAAFRAIDPARRKIITSHDAFGYFAQAYGVTFLSPVGLSTEAEPSAAAVAKLIRQIKAEGVKQVFVEKGLSPRLIEQIGKDSGATLGGTLYADTLSGAGGEAPTYLALMNSNAQKLLTALR